MALGACVACTPSSAPSSAAGPTAATPAAPAIGIDLAGIDKTVAPGDDFDAYANGAWRRTAVIPADRASTGIFLQVFQAAEQRNADLVKAIAASNPAAGSDERRIADYYAAYMDEAAIERAGLKPVQGEIDQANAIADKVALARVLGAGLRADVDPLNATNYYTDRLFGLFVTQDLQDPARNTAYLLQGGLGMPNRDYYLSADKEMAAIRDKYKTYVAALLTQAGIADADAKAASIYALEEKIAKAQASIVDTENVHNARAWRMDDFAKKAPGLDWAAYFQAAGLDGQPSITAWQPDAIAQLSALTASQPLQAWKDWLVFHAINRHAGLLPKAYADLAFGFYGTTLSGTPQQRERWKRALGAVNNALGDAVGKLYVQKYFPASSRTQVQQLVANLLAVFPERIDKLDWMDAATKAKAKAKVASMQVGVGYPDTWRDYSSLEIKADDALGNAERAELAEYRHQLAKLGQTPDHGEWWMTPQTVNAVNLPLQNALNFPAAILEPPFFDPNADAAANYGSIGAVIGHEISHSFDNLGSEFDAQGRLHNWWTPEDAAHFKAASQELVAQYAAYEPLPGLHINGEQTLGENIADLAGLEVAYQAYRKSLGGQPAPVIDGLTGDQRFFLAFAQSWRSKTRDAALRAQVIGDGHAPGRFRAQTVRNIDAWYDAFGAQPGQALYLAPEARVRIW
ncbi:M13 family peptidase [Luteimonas weifangensis]|uniref:M13 family peptidase n=2 Tax=Cognatiluteimonas weifangensis TaxID=2303539 RepID=A0A372DHH1_9GAMM|nr:M13 family peptidase [Luteimonas weifangensis]